MSDFDSPFDINVDLYELRFALEVRNIRGLRILLMVAISASILPSMVTLLNKAWQRSIS